MFHINISEYINSKKRCLRFIPLLICATFAGSGCSTFVSSRSQKATMMRDYESGDFKEAEEIAAEFAKKRSGTGDELMWMYEEGSAKFAAGDYKGSIKAFEKAEKIIYDYEHRATVSARDGLAETAAFFTTPNSLPYKGNYYEKILLNTFKGLDYMALGEMSGARVELRRAYERQKEAERRYEKEIRKAKEKSASRGFNVEQAIKDSADLREMEKSITAASNQKLADFANPFVSYLSAICYLSEGNYNEALVDFKRLRAMDGTIQLVARDYATCAKKIGATIPNDIKASPFDYPLDKNVVFVILASGLSPALKERKIHIPLPVLYTGVAFPVPEFQNSTSNTPLMIDSGNSFKVKTERISDMNAVFGEAYRKALPLTITRMVISAAARDAGTVALAVTMRKHPAVAIGSMLAASAYKYAFNRADLRSWQIVPGVFQAAQLPFPSDRVLKLRRGGMTKTIQLPESNRNFFIIYVNAPSNNVMECKIFTMR